ncbi:MAG: CPBP family intramembrane metalloprotease [Firmicutes bacterium]|nr:CPBP family intramembrane metalloprotease [Bacillota bacterium]
MLPQPEPLVKRKPLAIGGILMLLLYSFQNFIPGVASLSLMMGILITAAMVVVSLLLFLPELKRDVPLFFENFKTYCRFFFPRFGIFFLCYYAVALTITILAKVPAANQDLLMGVSLPLLAFTALIYAPVVEETIYRGFLRRLIADDTFFIIVSALVFGMIHMLHPDQTMAQYLYIIEYAMLGGFLAWLYVESDNICLSMMGHFCLNLAAFIPMVITVLMGV